MSQDKDGGPAFPISTIDGYNNSGMTMRQWYKGMAIQGMMANNEILERITEGSGMKFEFLAKSTGEIADAMVAEDQAHAKQG